ncbi:MAG: tetratricopeptide repeat protein [Chloroflexota bacterium]|nr:tetratricopeptide repeat protein [Chloroflexota bacterium]
MITKILLPQLPRGLLRRPRLVEFLHASVDCKLILLSATAGYGKTTLLTDFAHDTDIPVCWYALSPSDSDPRVFVEHFIASISHRFPDFGEQSRTVLGNTTKFDDEGMYPLVTAIVNEIYNAIAEYFIVILDDYHLVETSSAVNDFLNALLAHVPENCHLIIAGRTVPGGLSLVRLTARQQMIGLGTQDLRFTGDEIRALVTQNYDLDLPAETAEELARHSDGWITGIILTAQTTWKQLLAGVVETTGTRGQVYDYLTSEVFARQSPEVQEFLAVSSILNELSPTLCDALLDIHNSEEVLDFLMDRNLFIVRLEGRERWYRYHHLFQEFLQARLRRSDEDRFIELHRRAGRLLEERQSWDEAIAHYLMAQDWAEAGRAIEAVATETYQSGRWTTLLSWIDALPGDLLTARPVLRLHRAAVQAGLGKRDEALADYERAEADFAAQGDEEGVARALVGRGNVYRLQGGYQEAIETCEKALAIESANENTIAKAYRYIGICYVHQGQPIHGARYLEDALLFSQKLESRFDVANLHLDLGVAYSEAGDLATSSRHLREAQHHWKELRNTGQLARTLNSLGVNLHYQGELSAALETLQEALSTARQAGYWRLEGYALISLGDVHRDLGDTVQALETYEAGLHIAESMNEGFLIVYTLSALGETYRLLGQHEQADTRGRQALELAARHESPYELGICLTALGINCYERGDRVSARQYLGQAHEHLQQCGVARDLARAHFHLAQFAFLEGDSGEMRTHLDSALGLTEQLGYDQFLVADGKQIIPMLETAATDPPPDPRARQLLDKIGGLEQLTVRPEAGPVVAAAPVLPVLKAYALGQQQVFIDQQPVSRWLGAQTQEFFYYFLSHPEGMLKEQIGEVFWPDRSPAKMHSAFHATLFRLRRALFPDCVILESERYRLNPAIECWYDVEEFNRLLDEAERPQPDSAQTRLYQQAINLYQGDYLGQFYSDWCALERERLRDRYLRAVDSQAGVYIRQGKYDQAIALCQRALAADPYREVIYRRLMECAALAGDRAAAVRYYQQCSRMLEEDMDIEPMPETQALYEQIIAR